MSPLDAEPRREEVGRLRDRVESLVDAIHLNETRITALERDVLGLGERLPTNFGQWMGRTEASLQSLNVTVNELVEALKRGYVSIPEFEAAKKCHDDFATKAELEPIKSAFYKGIGLVLATVITGLLALILKK